VNDHAKFEQSTEVGVFFSPYPPPIEKLKDAVATCLDQTGADKVVLVGHSAGGWLARAALANGELGEGIASEDVVAGEREDETTPRGKRCTQSNVLK